MSKAPILLLTLLEDAPLHKKATPQELLFALKRGNQPASICPNINPLLDALEARVPPRAVFVQDSGPAYPEVAVHIQPLIDYVHQGGTVVVGWTFGTNLEPEWAGPFFARFGLPWTFGSYLRTKFHRNDWQNINPAGLRDAYSAKAYTLLNVAPEHAVYTPSATSYIESEVFPEDFFPVDPKEALVAIAPVGKGIVAYIGDVNDEIDSTKVCLALLGVPHDFLVAPANKERRFGVSVAGGAENDDDTMKVWSDQVRQPGKEPYSGIRIFGHPPLYALVSDKTAPWRQQGSGVPKADPNACHACGKFATLKCGRCKAVKYCGAPHQKQHWKHHKAVCKAAIASS